MLRVDVCLKSCLYKTPVRIGSVPLYRRKDCLAYATHRRGWVLAVPLNDELRNFHERNPNSGNLHFGGKEQADDGEERMRSTACNPHETVGIVACDPY